MKAVWLRPRAEQDLIDATRYYRQQGGGALAGRMLDAALLALARLSETPAIGSTRIGDLCELPGLRSWPVPGFALLWFYLEADRHVDVIRLLGKRQDITVIPGDAMNGDPTAG